MLALAALGAVLVACGGAGPSQDAAVDAMRLRWACPAQWVAAARGGCGPAVWLCVPDGGAAPGACDGVDITRPASVEPSMSDGGNDGSLGLTGTTFYRTPDGGIGGGWPAHDWSPDAGIPQCAPGWRRETDGTCDPALRMDCPTGALPLPGGMCTPTAATNCPSGDYADPGPEAMGASVVRVRAGGDDAMADGSVDRPFGTVASAVVRAGAGGWVLVGAGRFVVQLASTDSVHILGLCAARTTLRGQSDTDPIVSASGTAANVDLRNVTLSGGAPAARASMGATVRLSSVAIDGVALHGAQAIGAGSRVEVRGSTVRNVRAAADGTMGRGLQTESGGTVTAEATAIDTVVGRGVSASPAPSSVVLRDVLVRNVAIDPALGAGIGVAAIGGGRAILERVAIGSVSGIGVMSGSVMSDVSLTDVAIRDTRAQRSGSLAAGIAVGSTGQLRGERTSLRNTCCAGVLATQARSRATLIDSVITDMVDVPNGQSGFGAQATDGASVDLIGTRVSRSISQGVDVLGAGSRARLERSVVEFTRRRDDGTAGVGIEVATGGILDVQSSLVRANDLAGILVDGEATVATVGASLLRGSPPDNPGGRGLSVQNGASLDMTRTLIDATSVVGYYSAGGGTHTVASDIAVTGTRATMEGRAGHGIDCLEAAVCEVRRAALVGNREAAAAAALGFAELTLDQVLVADVAPTENNAGAGVVAAGRGSVRGTSVGVYGAHGAAIMSTGLASELGAMGSARVDLDGVYVSRVVTTRIQYLVAMPIDRSVAYGLHSSSGCTLVATHAVLDSGGYGFFADESPMMLDGVVVTRMLDAAGAVSDRVNPTAVTIRGESLIDNANNAILRGVTLPSATALAPPTPVGM